MGTILINCILEKQIEDKGFGQEYSEFFYDLAKEVAKLAEQHGLNHRMYYNSRKD
mgnify:CR=1 FL=1|jgi:hypothetical protein|tara:strand:+ start:711 stop:875 length:165 start_codon:yes stop_codon:yes gene_type:complete